MEMTCSETSGRDDISIDSEKAGDTSWVGKELRRPWKMGWRRSWRLWYSVGMYCW